MLSPTSRLRGRLRGVSRRDDIPVPRESVQHSAVRYVGLLGAERTRTKQVHNHLTRTVAASSDRTITTCLIIRWCAKDAWVRREWPERGSMPEVVPGRPDVFSKQQVESVHRMVCGPRSSKKFKMTHYYLQSGQPHPDHLNREVYTSDCNGRAFPVFEKLFRWGPDLLSMDELLLTVGERSAAAMVARRHDPRYVVYRISPNYLEALSTDGWPADEACS